jgi:cullin-associated NEDD8-dissociated protein 1
MVAECLGKLAAIAPDRILQYLALKSRAEQPLVRWTVVTSVKYISTMETPAAALTQHAPQLAKLLKDEDLHVRRAAIIGFNSIAHHRPRVIRDIAQADIIPVLFEMTAVNPALKRTVDLGPFKHTVDDGLPLRKASFQCLLTMLDTMPDVMPVQKFLEHVAKGLADVDDVAMLGHQITAVIANYSPHLLLAEVAVLLDPLTASISKSPKDATAAASNHADDVIRSALRALDAIARIPESSQNRRIMEIIALVQSKEHLVSFVQADHLDALQAFTSKKQLR